MTRHDPDLGWEAFKSRILAELRLTDEQRAKLHVRLRGQHPSGYSRSLDLDRMEYERDEGPHNETFYIRGQ